MNNENIENVKITNVKLGFEDHGILTMSIGLEGNGWYQGYGGYAMDAPDKNKKVRVGSAYGTQCIIDLLNTFEIEDINQLTGLNARIKRDDDNWNSPIVAIGHIIKNKWFSFKELADKMKENK